MKKLLSLTVLVLLIFTGCQIGTPQTGPVSIGLDYTLGAVFSQNMAASSAKDITAKGPESYTGSLVAENIGSGTSETFDWFAVIDEDAFFIDSSKTGILDPGNYNFYLTLTKGSHQYYGESLGQTLVDGQFNIPMTLKPVIGSVVSDISLSQIAAFKFRYPADEFAGISTPKLGYTIDNGNETIIELAAGTNETWFNLAPGTHTIELALYDGNKQIGRSVTAQENVTVMLTEGVTMDMVPLHAEAAFNLNLQGGDAKFVVTIPEEVKEEVGNSTNIVVILNMTSPVNGPQEVVLTLRDEANGTVTGEHTFSDFKFDTVNMSLTFKDKTTGDILGSSVKEGVELGKDTKIVVFDLELIRRAVISGNLLSVLGINVYDTNNLPMANANVYINGEFVGITGNSTFGAAGYLKLYLAKGEYRIKAETGSLSAEQNVTLNSFGITGIDLVLKSEIVIFPDSALNSMIRSAINKPEGDILKSDLEALTSFRATMRGISDISGIEHCVNLTNLFLTSNQISDITPLDGLSYLTILDLNDNQISDIKPLGGLTKLKRLELLRNQISDISPLAGLTALNSLYLSLNQISDIAPLSGLTNLTRLYFFGNQVTSIQALTGMVGLKELSMGDNQISTISAISGLTNLTTLNMNSNQITDISPVSGLTNLAELSIIANQIKDISLLSGLTKLNKLELKENGMHITQYTFSGQKNLAIVQQLLSSGCSIPEWGVGNITDAYFPYGSGSGPSGGPRG